MTTCSKVLASSLIAILQTCAAFGQTAATINGLVTDPSGLAIPGATVTATNTQTNLIRPTVTNNAGNYDIPNLPPGTYSVAWKDKASNQ